MRANVENERVVTLTWTTESEENVSHFDLEYSHNTEEWVVIDRLEAKNQSNTNHYKATHHPTSGGSHYYRLKMQDLDGTYTYTDLVAAKTTQNIELEVFPIPARNTLTVNTNQTAANLQIIDMMGRVLIQEKLTDYQHTINIHHLPNGNYFLRLQQKEVVETRPIVKTQ